MTLPFRIDWESIMKDNPDTVGWLYSEADHLMIYGHRMKDDSMLGSAADYAGEQYYRQHPFLHFLTPEQTWRAEVIGCRTVHAEEKYFPVLFGDDEIYAAYIRKITAQRYYDTDAEPDTSFRLLTLVTCSTYTRGGDVRLLVQARPVPVKIA